MAVEMAIWRMTDAGPRHLVSSPRSLPATRCQPSNPWPLIRHGDGPRSAVVTEHTEAHPGPGRVKAGLNCAIQWVG